VKAAADPTIEHMFHEERGKGGGDYFL